MANETGPEAGTDPAYDTAYTATNPADSDEARHTAAVAILQGQAANAIYWSHRGRLEQLEAAASGHGEVVRADRDPAQPVETTDATAISGGDGGTTDPPGTEAEPVHDAEVVPEPNPSPDNPNAAIAALRAQLVNAGITPEV